MWLFEHPMNFIIVILINRLRGIDYIFSLINNIKYIGSLHCYWKILNEMNIDEMFFHAGISFVQQS